MPEQKASATDFLGQIAYKPPFLFTIPPNIARPLSHLRDIHRATSFQHQHSTSTKSAVDFR
ncbi:hypothetical protein [Pasteurella sp. PK-2025]|uniref:hypothetical protein n=1 Tax=Pasteurella sp. PK-2025 TaxID=3413133 RepID=UPI003C715068